MRRGPTSPSTVYPALAFSGTPHAPVSPFAIRKPTATPVPLGSDAGIALPASLSAGVTLSLNLGVKPENGTTTLILGLDDTAAVDAHLVVTINGVPCPRLADHLAPEMFPASIRALQFACPPEAVVRGHNTLGVTPLTDASAVQIIWAEVRVEP